MIKTKVYCGKIPKSHFHYVKCQKWKKKVDHFLFCRRRQGYELRSLGDGGFRLLITVRYIYIYIFLHLGREKYFSALLLYRKKWLQRAEKWFSRPLPLKIRRAEKQFSRPLPLKIPSVQKALYSPRAENAFSRTWLFWELVPLVPKNRRGRENAFSALGL